MFVGHEIDPADQLSSGLDLLRTATAALQSRDLEDAKTRQAIADTIGHALATMDPVHEFLESCRTIAEPIPKLKLSKPKRRRA